MSVRMNDGSSAPGGERLLADAASAAHGAPERLSAVLTDLFLPDAHRPTDRQRSVMTLLLAGLARQVERALRDALAPMFDAEAAPELVAALDSARTEIAAPILARARILRDRELVALLLARAEEYRIVSGLRRIAEAGLDRIDDAAAADAADAEEAALLNAESRRFDRFHEPVIDSRDLPAEVLHRLVWRVAAALRDYMVRVQRIDPAMADGAAMAAANRLLSAHDEGEAIEAAAMRFARHLNGAGRADDAALVRALHLGRFALFVALMAVRAGIDHGAAFAMATDPGIGRLALLLRAIGVADDAATGILFEMAAINGLPEDRLAERIEDCRAIAPDAAGEAIRPWRLDDGYRAAMAELAAGLAAAR
ncbi:MAG: hypothetical protein ABS87_09460 [Sphingomonas sp. SCN 67-18]|nr:MAG: hypothetical protein ABS87_09460 [Sphingomonas sp. SCN 67-18]